MKEKITFQNSKGDKLVGILSDSGSKTILIMCHGFSSSKESRTYVNLEKILNKENIATFRFDFYGHGESDGKFEDITISEAVDDILNAIALMKKKGFQKIGLEGTSFGGIAAILAASKSKNLFVLALKSPLSDVKDKMAEDVMDNDMKKWKKTGFSMYKSSKHGSLRLNYSYIEDGFKQDAYKAAKKITVPTLIVHGDKDDCVPFSQSEKLAKSISNSKLVVISGAGHDYKKKKDYERSLKEIVDFIKYYS